MDVFHRARLAGARWTAGTSLAAKGGAIQAKVAAGNTKGACSALRTFENAVKASSRAKSVSRAKAFALLSEARRVSAMLRC